MSDLIEPRFHIQQESTSMSRYILQCIINTSSATPKRHLKTAGLYEFALFLIIVCLIRDHQTMYEIYNKNIKDK